MAGCGPLDAGRSMTARLRQLRKRGLLTYCEKTNKWQYDV